MLTHLFARSSLHERKKYRLFNITFSENGVYDFGDFILEESSSIEVGSFATIFGGAGLGYRHKRYNLLGKLSYHRGFQKIFSTSSDILSDNPNDLKSLSNLNNSIVLSQLLLGFSIQYHF